MYDGAGFQPPGPNCVEDGMTAITVGRELADQLRRLDDAVVLLDEAGKMLGSFQRTYILPPPYDPADLPPPLSEEEIARRLAEGPLMTTEEVLAKLKELE